jgi:ribosomal protein S18 acetylase RimI-like enzyme
MTPEISYRMAEVSECETLAEMINMASGGVVDFLFHDLVPEMTPVRIIAGNLARGGAAHSYENAHVAVYNKRVVGMALAFSADYHAIGTDMRAFFPGERLAHMEDFYNARVEGSLLLDALFVAADFRNRGVGHRLIEQVRARAAAAEYESVSLIVFADNETALRLYRRQGFETVRQVDVAPHELIPHQGGCLLMKCDIR